MQLIQQTKCKEKKCGCSYVSAWSKVILTFNSVFYFEVCTASSHLTFNLAYAGSKIKEHVVGPSIVEQRNSLR